MPTYRSSLPLLSDDVFLTDSGMETDLIFHGGFDLPEFASFPLMERPDGADALRQYYRGHLQVAADAGVGFVFEAVTWRASRDWGTALGYDSDGIADVNRRAIDFVAELREEAAGHPGPLVLSAALGPRGDAYRPDRLMTAEDAEAYHREQLETLADTETDLVTAMTLTYADEAIGMVRAAQAVELPIVVSFTVETDGTLPDGSELGATISRVDAATDAGPIYFGVNCAHPTHFADILDPDAEWTGRIRMVRANASRMSHAELDEAPELDDGDPAEFGREYADLRRDFPHLTELGGCCGTDVRHIQAVATACL